MYETLGRVFHDLISRWDGPLHFRLIVQPLMAIVLAVRDGLRDERNSEPAFFWALFTEPDLRPTLIRNGWHSIARIFILAVVLDVIYQLLVLHWFYPFETLIVATFLALVPYTLLRGIVNRVKRTFNGPSNSRSTVSTANKSGGPGGS